MIVFAAHDRSTDLEFKIKNLQLFLKALYF